MEEAGEGFESLTCGHYQILVSFYSCFDRLPQRLPKSLNSSLTQSLSEL